ncbi:MAG: bifunctional 3-(3-hydroxy-phenyl)propionate/3-hydroxycinnamic acid hydroxylase [Acidimicrobiia bacterium]
MFDVAVIGCGPVGAMLSLLLSRRGLRVIAFDRVLQISQQPRAVYFDGETMRLFQRAGVAERLLSRIQPALGMDCVSMSGEVLLRYEAPSRPDHSGWHSGYYCRQPEVEQILREELAGQPTAVLETGTEVEHIHAHDAGVTLTVRSAAGEKRIDAKFAVGCCGARSSTRRSMGVQLKDLGGDKDWLVVDVLLREHVDLPLVTTQYCDPRSPSTFVPLPGTRRRFEFMLHDHEAADLDVPSIVETRLRRWLPEGSYEVERAVVYAFHTVHAVGWRRGPVMLAGDAAHQMPPFLGQGLCAGLRDASNLEWKLNAVCRGNAADELLDTYEPERLPHVQAVMADDLALGEYIQMTDSVRVAERDAAVRAHGRPYSITQKIYPIGQGLCAPGDVTRIPLPQFEGLPHRVDSVLGDGFALLGSAQVSADMNERLVRLGLVRIQDVPAVVQQWLETHLATAVLVRPDRIVAALETSPGAIDSAVSSWGTWSLPVQP